MKTFSRNIFHNTQTISEDGVVITVETEEPGHKHRNNSIALRALELNNGPPDGSFFKTVAEARGYCYRLEYAIRFFTQDTLSMAQREVLCFILRRTIYWGKVAEGISSKHFVEGIYEKYTGFCITKGLNLTYKTVITALQNLGSMGLVATIIVKGTYTWPNIYAVNLGKLQELLDKRSEKEIEMIRLARENRVKSGGKDEETQNISEIEEMPTYSAKTLPQVIEIDKETALSYTNSTPCNSAGGTPCKRIALIRKEEEREEREEKKENTEDRIFNPTVCVGFIRAEEGVRATAADAQRFDGPLLRTPKNEHKVRLTGLKQSRREKIENDITQAEALGREVFDSPQEAVRAKVKSAVDTRAKRVTEKANNESSLFTQYAFGHSWNAAIESYNRELQSGDAASRGQYCSNANVSIYAKAFKTSEPFVSGDWRAYMEDVITRWQYYRDDALLLPWVQRKRMQISVAPSIGSFRTMHKVFYERYCNDNSGASRDEVTSRLTDRATIDKLRAELQNLRAEHERQIEHYKAREAQAVKKWEEAVSNNDPEYYQALKQHLAESSKVQSRGIAKPRQLTKDDLLVELSPALEDTESQPAATRNSRKPRKRT